jgi:hypothetical protein
MAENSLWDALEPAILRRGGLRDGKVNKPFIYVVIVILWITALVAYLLMNRYQVRYDHGNGATSVLDKWTGTVQTILMDNGNASSKGPDKAYPRKNDLENGVKARAPKPMPEVKDGIQKKEP